MSIAKCAIDNFTKVISLDSKYIKMYWTHAKLYVRKKHEPLCVEHLEAALQELPDEKKKLLEDVIDAYEAVYLWGGENELDKLIDSL